ncbi:MAG: hypothetical protein K0R08_365 [Solimicrobium sp.]|jgi:hypothetical protein|nr:hypothetical protein [Solimicrobium sp.]
MHHINSKDNTAGPRSKDRNDNWQKQSYSNMETIKIMLSNVISMEHFN